MTDLFEQPPDKPRRLVFLASVWPEPQSSAAGVRAYDIISILLEGGWRVTYASIAKPSEHMTQVAALGAEVACIAPNDPAFDEWISGQAPEVVIFDRFILEEQFGWRVKSHCPSALRVLNTEDLHSLRRARQMALEAGASLTDIADCRFEFPTPDALRELASIFRSDLTWLVSDFEARLLCERLRVPAEDLRIYPYFAPPPLASRLFEERGGFAMIGNFRHPPNADAVRWLKRDLWPRIRSLLPSATVRVYGAYPAREHQELHSPPEGFFMEGWAQTPGAAFSRARVNLAPLRFGAGIKGKIIEGWLSGIPAVTTPLGAEGLGNPFGGLVVPEANAFAQAAARLHEDAALWTQLAEVGRATTQERLSRSVNAPRLLTELEDAFRGREATRARNIIGKMVWHQSLRATEYFSRWIEAKNKA